MLAQLGETLIVLLGPFGALYPTVQAPCKCAVNPAEDGLVRLSSAAEGQVSGALEVSPQAARAAKRPLHASPVGLFKAGNALRVGGEGH